MKPQIIVNIQVEVKNVFNLDAVLLERELIHAVQKSISGMNFEQSPANKVLDMISLVVLQFYPNLSLEDIRKNGREFKFVIPRQIVMVLATKFHSIKSKAIAEYFGGRDRTCVCHANSSISGYLDVDKVFKKHYQNIENVYINLLKRKEDNEQYTHTTDN